MRFLSLLAGLATLCGSHSSNIVNQHMNLRVQVEIGTHVVRGTLDEYQRRTSWQLSFDNLQTSETLLEVPVHPTWSTVLMGKTRNFNGTFYYNGLLPLDPNALYALAVWETTSDSSGQQLRAQRVVYTDALQQDIHLRVHSEFQGSRRIWSCVFWTCVALVAGFYALGVLLPARNHTHSLQRPLDQEQEGATQIEESDQPEHHHQQRDQHWREYQPDGNPHTRCITPGNTLLQHPRVHSHSRQNFHEQRRAWGFDEHSRLRRSLEPQPVPSFDSMHAAFQDAPFRHETVPYLAYSSQQTRRPLVTPVGANPFVNSKGILGHDRGRQAALPPSALYNHFGAASRSDSTMTEVPLGCRESMYIAGGKPNGADLAGVFRPNPTAPLPTQVLRPATQSYSAQGISGLTASRIVANQVLEPNARSPRSTLTTTLCGPAVQGPDIMDTTTPVVGEVQLNQTHASVFQNGDAEHGMKSRPDTGRSVQQQATALQVPGVGPPSSMTQGADSGTGISATTTPTAPGDASQSILDTRQAAACVVHTIVDRVCTSQQGAVSSTSSSIDKPTSGNDPSRGSQKPAVNPSERSIREAKACGPSSTIVTRRMEATRPNVPKIMDAHITASPTKPIRVDKPVAEPEPISNDTSEVAPTSSDNTDAPVQLGSKTTVEDDKSMDTSSVTTQSDTSKVLMCSNNHSLSFEEARALCCQQTIAPLTKSKEQQMERSVKKRVRQTRASIAASLKRLPIRKDALPVSPAMTYTSTLPADSTASDEGSKGKIVVARSDKGGRELHNNATDEEIDFAFDFDHGMKNEGKKVVDELSSGPTQVAPEKQAPGTLSGRTLRSHFKVTKVNGRDPVNHHPALTHRKVSNTHARTKTRLVVTSRPTVIPCQKKPNAKPAASPEVRFLGSHRASDPVPDVPLSSAILSAAKSCERSEGWSFSKNRSRKRIPKSITIEKHQEGIVLAGATAKKHGSVTPVSPLDPPTKKQRRFGGKKRE